MDGPFRIIPKCGRDDCARILGIGEEDDNYPKQLIKLQNRALFKDNSVT